MLDIIRSSEGPFSADTLTPVAQVDGDAQLLELWLHGRSPHTQRAYRTDVDHFLAYVRKPLRMVTVGDVQAWMDTLDHLAPGSQARKISSVKSLFGFGHRLGYLPFDVGRVVKRPKLKDTLAERILSEGDVFKLFAAAEQPPARRRTPIQETRARRNYVLLRRRRSETILRDEFRCQCCGREKRLQIHHLSYAHLGNEYPSEMLSLCRSCHEKVTSEERQMRPHGC